MLTEMDKKTLSQMRNVLAATNQAEAIRLKRQAEMIRQMIGAAVMRHIDNPEVMRVLTSLALEMLLTDKLARKFCGAVEIDTFDLNSLLKRHAHIVARIAEFQPAATAKAKKDKAATRPTVS